MPDPDRLETWTAAECADAWGIAVPTWFGYVSRGHAPAPLPGYDEQRRRRWDAETVRAWPRPGRGSRSDLRGRQ